MNLPIEVIKLHPDVQIPERGSDKAAGVDLRIHFTEHGQLHLKPGATKLVGTGLKIFINNPGWAGFIFPRSGLGSRGLVLGNGTGVIDADYQGELKVCLWNRGEEEFIFNTGDRIAQLVFLPVGIPWMNEVQEFAPSIRGEGGFGHTGTK